MYIASSVIPDGSVVGLCAGNGFQTAMGTGQIRLDRYYDNQHTDQSRVGNIDLTNNAFCLCAKNRFELAKFLKSFSIFSVTCNQQIGISKGAYYVKKSAILSKGMKSIFAGVTTAKINMKNITGSEGTSGHLSGFTTTANSRHELTRVHLSDYGFYLLMFKHAVGPLGNPNVFMTPNNTFGFSQIASMMGPALFAGPTKDKDKKAQPIDWFGVQARRQFEAQQDLTNNQMDEINFRGF